MTDHTTQTTITIQLVSNGEIVDTIETYNVEVSSDLGWTVDHPDIDLDGIDELRIPVPEER